jgi:hypothetical protein
MKIIITFIILILSIFADSRIKFEDNQIHKNKVIENIGFSPRTINFKVLCIDGYKYLFTDNNSTTNTIQMFYRLKNTRDSVPIRCDGYEETRN